ncbi:MAG: hypothetical protein KJZ83_13525 [Burkholderiaceae bacterium]|nr:hypothetical protein [Burkholderiaceae bacterium]
MLDRHTEVRAAELGQDRAVHGDHLAGEVQHRSAAAARGGRGIVDDRFVGDLREAELPDPRERFLALPG